uniref:Uncharacterized protein n=1 Tax=Romanomermis culicivorax TaxID=13658 RepID=A0A915HNE1_ROMCU
MIDMTRSRWLCLTPGGDLYLVTGDNNVSALWRYSSSNNNWVTILTATGTTSHCKKIAFNPVKFKLPRFFPCAIVCALAVIEQAKYQYLDFMEQNELDDFDRPTVTLLTCECLLGNLILLTIKDDRLLSQVVLQSIYRIQDHIFSPSSAVRDQFSNLIILDYANNGKLFLFEAPESDRTKNRRLKLLMEIGSQEGMGLCVEDGWCYVVCVNKKRVKAIQYKEM